MASLLFMNEADKFSIMLQAIKGDEYAMELMRRLEREEEEYENRKLKEQNSTDETTTD